MQNQNSPWQNLNGNPGFNNQPIGYGNNNQNSGFMNFMQGGGFGNPNYQMGQMGQNNPNYGFNQANNKPPIPFSTGNVNRNFFHIIRNNCKRTEIGWNFKTNFRKNKKLAYQIT
jgi:hypothetical protein